MSEPKSNSAIIGMGLSGLLFADQILRDDPLGNSHYLLIDAKENDLSHQTFCYWWPKGESSHPYQEFVSHAWDYFKVIGPALPGTATEKTFSFGDFQYQRIPGEALGKAILSRLKNSSRFTFLPDSVLSLTSVDQGVDLELKRGGIIRVDRVWTSVTKNQAKLHQHFLGYEVEVAHDFLDAAVMSLMDFSVPQLGQVQFVYILPFSASQGLIEFTAFSTRSFDEKYYEAQLRAYLSDHLKLKAFSIKRVESGSIPMATLDRPSALWAKPQTRITPIGTAAGAIKSTTGFSFRRNLKINSHPSRLKAVMRSRFVFYDRLLLEIFQTDDNRGAEILSTLFSKNHPNLVFRFLDEDTEVIEEIKIFWSLPWSPFLLTLLAKHLFLIAAVCSFILPTSWVMGISVLGLLLIGIPHGAVDRLLAPVGQTASKFYGRYLLGIAAFCSVAYLSRPIAILIFVLISADHFGECEFSSLLQGNPRARRLKTLSFIWGACAIIVPCLFHWKEAAQILTVMVGPVAFSLEKLGQIWIFKLLALIAGLFASAMFDRESAKHEKNSHHLRNTFFLYGFFALVSLLPGFLSFFCFWHSWDSMTQQRQKYHWKLREYWKLATPMATIAFFGVAAASLVYRLTPGAERAMSSLLTLLGALTFSHSRVMKSFYYGND